MKPDILKQWVQALRSGRYKQGKEQLKIINGIPRYCCLGVLCDLHALATGQAWNEESYIGEANSLPDKVMKWAGLEENDPVLIQKGTGRADTAAELNDCGRRFKTIARLIVAAQKKKLL